jgi:hypothetical protein
MHKQCVHGPRNTDMSSLAVLHTVDLIARNSLWPLSLAKPVHATTAHVCMCR